MNSGFISSGSGSCQKLSRDQSNCKCHFASCRDVLLLEAQLVLAKAPSQKLCFVMLQEIDTQSNQPSLLRGQTGSETEAQFVQVFQQADSDLTGMISRQVRHVLYCSPAYKAAHLPSYHIQEVTEQSLLCYPMIILFETDSDQRCMHSSTAVGCFARHHSQSVYCS